MSAKVQRQRNRAMGLDGLNESLGTDGARRRTKLHPHVEAEIVKQGLEEGSSVLMLTMCTTTVCFAAGISSPVQSICQFSLMQTMILLSYCTLSECPCQY